MVRRLKEDIRSVQGGFPQRKVARIAIDGLAEDTPELVLSRLIREGALAYVPIHGDLSSTPDSLILMQADRRQKGEVMKIVAGALEKRQRPLSLIFWRCEDIDPNLLTEFRGTFSENLSVPVDAFFLTDQDDTVRDLSLEALEIHRVRATLKDVKDAVKARVVPAAGYEAFTWHHGERAFMLPDVARLSKGLVEHFERVRSVGFTPSAASGADFLLGAPPTVDDILDGRVVRRNVLDGNIVPAIRSALSRRDSSFQVVVVQGRAGSGISTLLCYAAYLFNKDHGVPVFVALRSAGRSLDEWKEAGRLIGESSRTVKSPAIVIVDFYESSWHSLEALLEGAIDANGDVVLLIGGRREMLSELTRDLPLQVRTTVEVSDSLSDPEWQRLAGILQQNGFSRTLPLPALIKQLVSVGQLLPAIYQSTDRMNRKFREIVSYEYHRYNADRLVQRAYRFVCYLGSYGLRITQFWLLKALGNTSLADGFFILQRLSDDIVLYGTEGEGPATEHLIGPRHRLIAEAVLEIAVPEPSHRLVDLRELIATANLASSLEGEQIVQLLRHKGPLMEWLRGVFQDKGSRYLEISRLYETALGGQPIRRNIELVLRQHYALALRRLGLLEEALENIIKADSLESDNAATTHITGLIYMDRAIAAWRLYATGSSESHQALSRAASDEEMLCSSFVERASVNR